MIQKILLFWKREKLLSMRLTLIILSKNLKKKEFILLQESLFLKTEILLHTEKENTPSGIQRIIVRGLEFVNMFP